jgi:hypothetical protein
VDKKVNWPLWPCFIQWITPMRFIICIHISGIDVLRNKFRDWRLHLGCLYFRTVTESAWSVTVTLSNRQCDCESKFLPIFSRAYVVSSSGGYKNISIWSSGSLLLALKWKCPETCRQFCKKEVFTRHIPQNANFLSITRGCHYVAPSSYTRALTSWCPAGVYLIG